MQNKARRWAVSLAAGALLAMSLTPAPAEEAPMEGLFVVSFSAGPEWRAGVPMSSQSGMRAHGEYMARLHAEGRLYAGGPYMRDDGAAMGEGGLMIVRARSREEVEDILAIDPAITGGLFVPEVMRWRPRFRSDEPLPPWE